MVNLPEVKAGMAAIMTLGEQADGTIAQAIEGLSVTEAIKVAKEITQEYQQDLKEIINDSLVEAAEASSSYYGGALAGEALLDVIDKSKKEKYYGLTLAARLAVNHVRLKRNIDKAAAVDVKHLGGIYTKPYPFGAQVNTDMRVLQATAHKLEQDIALHYAKEQNVKLRWKTSAGHNKPDICDDLVGEYTAATLPRPPHPFCRCEFELVQDSEVPRERRFARTIEKLSSLIRRLR